MNKLSTFFLPVLMPVLTFAQNEQDGYKLTKDSIRLEEVVITGTLPLNDKQVEKIYRANCLSTIDNVIEKLDGMSMIRRGSYAMEPVLNGLSGGQLSITIDGMKMFGACTDKMDPITSYIEPSNLKSITVVQGSEGCHSGCSIGGSIDMSLKEPDCRNVHPFYGSFALGYESVFNGKTTLLTTGYAKKKWQWGLNGVYRKNNSYTDGFGQVVPYTQYEKTNLHSVLKFLPDSNQSFKADMLYDLALNVGYAALPMDVAKARAYIIALEYKRLKPVALVAKIYYNSILHIMDGSKRDSAYYVTNNNTGENELVFMTMDMPGTSSTLGAYVRTVFTLNQRNRLTIQADNYSNHSLAEMTMHMHYPGSPPEEPMYLQTWPDLIRNVTGLFFQETWMPSSMVTLNVSGRLDYNLSMLQSDLAKEQFSVLNVDLADNYQMLTKNCNVSVRYHPTDPLSFTLETGYSERIPTVGEQFGYYLYNAYDGYDYIGSPDISSEKSEFGRIAVQFTKPWLKINLSQSIYFVHDYIMGITDMNVSPMNFYTNGTRVYSNVPGAKIYNANLQVQAIPVRHLSLFLLTKFTWGELNSGNPLPLIPPLDNILAISYQQSKWSCSLENETAMAQNRINTGYGEITSPAFTLFNIKGSYQFSFPKNILIDCSLAVTNIFSALYYEHLDWGRIYRPGRSFDILLKVSF